MYETNDKKTADIFGAGCETALRSIPPPPADLKPDATSAMTQNKGLRVLLPE